MATSGSPAGNLTSYQPSEAALFEAGRVRRYSIEAAALGLPATVAGALRGGDPAENAAILRKVLGGETGARRDVVLINAAAALWVAAAAGDLEEGLVMARESIDSGEARERLEHLVRATTS